MNRSTRILSNIFANIPTTLVFCWFIQQLSIWKGELPAFSLHSYLINLPIGYITGLLTGFLLPGAAWGIRFADACGAKEGTWRHMALMDLIANTVNSTVMIIVMTYVNVHIFGHAPLQAVLAGVIGYYIPVWAAGYLISYLSVPFCQRLAKKCTGEK